MTEVRSQPNATNPIAYRHVLPYLSDFRWHALGELVEASTGNILPEDAAEFFRDKSANETQREHRSLMPHGIQVARGKREMVQRALGGSVVRRYVVVRDENETTLYRMNSWFCWAGGSRVVCDPRPPNGKCENCNKGNCE